MSKLCTLSNASLPPSLSSSSYSSSFTFNFQAHSPLRFYNSRRKRWCRNSRAKMCSRNSLPQNDTVVQGGGNALTCVARLALKARVISKVADDSQGRGILDELQADGVDTSFIVVSKEGTSPFTYIIVDNQT